MDKRIIKNYLYNTAYQLLIIILPLITTPYISRAIGADGIGAYNYTNSITQYFILFGCIGLNLYGQREIAYHQHDTQMISKIFYELVILRIMTISLCLAIFYITMVQHTTGTYELLFRIQMIDIIAAGIDISWLFQGNEDFKKIAIRNFIVRILCVACIFLFVKNPDDIYIYVLCYSATLIFGNLSLWVYVPKLIHRTKLSSLNITRHIRPTIILFIPQIASSVYTVLDKTMIGYITVNNSEVAFYTQAQVLIKTILALLTSLGTVMLPRIANLFKLNQFEKIYEHLKQSFQFTFFLAFPMCFGLIAISRSIVPWFFGEGFEKVIPNIQVIAPIIILIGMSNIMGTQYLLPLGKQKEYTISVTSGMIVNILLNIILIPRLASIGASLASVVAESMVTIIQFLYVKNELNLKPIFRSGYVYIFSSLLMFLVISILVFKIPSTIINSFICILIGIFIYFMILILLKDNTVKIVFRFFNKNHH